MPGTPCSTSTRFVAPVALMSSAVMTLTADGALLSDLAVCVDMVTFCSISSSRDSERKCLSLSSGLAIAPEAVSRQITGAVWHSWYHRLRVGGTDPFCAVGRGMPSKQSFGRFGLCMVVSFPVWSAGPACAMCRGCSPDAWRLCPRIAATTEVLATTRAPATPLAVVSAIPWRIFYFLENPVNLPLTNKLQTWNLGSV